MAELTDIEKTALLKQAFPGIDDKAIAADLPYIKTAKDVQYIIDNEGVLPNQAFWQRNLKGIAKKADLPQAFWMEHPLGGAAVVGGGIAQALGKSSIGRLIAAKFAKKGAETTGEVVGEAITTKAKMSLKKKALIGAVGIYGGAQAAGSIGKAMGGNNQDQTSAAQLGIQADEQAIVAALANGADPNALVNSPLNKQLGLKIADLPGLKLQYGQDAAISGLGNFGVYTGKQVTVPGSWMAPLKPGTKTPDTLKPEVVSTGNWEKMFPTTAEGIKDIRNKFQSAGIMFTGNAMEQDKQLHAAWTYYGEQSQAYSKAGAKMTPWDILNLTKGISGSGGSQTSTTIDTSPMAESDVKTLTKRQLAQSLGLANVDDKMFQDILKIVRKNEAKNPSKTIRTTTGNTTRVKTTPGYGQSDVLADVEAYAKQDPRYSDFQTADVFGNALTKALGLKA